MVDMIRTGRRGGIIKGCLTVLFLGFAALVVMALLTRPKGQPAAPPVVADRPAPPPAPSVAPPFAAPPVSEDKPGAPLPEGLAIGDRVEVTGPGFCFVSLDLYRRRPPDGKRPQGAKNGKDVINLGICQLCTVTSLDRDAVMVRVERGFWKGRAAWVDPARVRKALTKEESDADVIRGLTQAVRREIYMARFESGMNATRAAEAKFPMDVITAGTEESKKAYDGRTILYNKVKLEGERAVMKKYKIDRAQLDAIEKEGFERRWPLSEDDRPAEAEPEEVK